MSKKKQVSYTYGSAKADRFWDAVQDANPATREELIALAKSIGMTWGECAEMSTRYDGRLGTHSAYLRQIRNNKEAW